MTEAYLHYIWQHQLFDRQNLLTDSGEPISIIQRGYHNTNAGPDFLEARIQIGDTQWAGHVEIHVAASDWLKHKHDGDRGYDNVILHVVYENDVSIRMASGEKLSTLVLQDKFDEMGYWRYEQFVSEQKFLACENVLLDVEPIIVQNMVERALLERLEEKATRIEQIYSQTGGDWRETFYRVLFYAFGLKVNAHAMLALAELLPEKIVRKHAENSNQIEALLFGVSGLLEELDDYSSILLKEFRFLKSKYQLEVLEPAQWKFARMRPAGFPTIRIAQLAAALSHNPDVFRTLIEAKELNMVQAMFRHMPNIYWTAHYRFGKVAKAVPKPLTESFIVLVIINALVPSLFAYAKQTGKPEYKERAMEWLQGLKPEQNKVVKAMVKTGFKLENAADSQGALQLYNAYCRQRKCLSCAIGVKLLNR